MASSHITGRDIQQPVMVSSLSVILAARRRLPADHPTSCTPSYKQDNLEKQDKHEKHEKHETQGKHEKQDKHWKQAKHEKQENQGRHEKQEKNILAVMLVRRSPRPPE
jgi:hypothetical protein